MLIRKTTYYSQTAARKAYDAGRAAARRGQDRECPYLVQSGNWAYLTREWLEGFDSVRKRAAYTDPKADKPSPSR